MPTIIDGNTGIQTSKVLGSDTPPTAANELTRKDYVDSKTPVRTWKTPVRAVNTTYTNNTGYEIFVAIIPNSTGTTTNFNIDGVERGYGLGVIYLPVPAGSTYIAPLVSGGIYRWSEFSAGA